jgi:hypothetical protein
MAPMSAEVRAGDDAIAIDADTAAAADTAPSGIDLGTIGRDVIVEMRVVMSTDDVQRSVSSISARASALGGGVASSDVDFGLGDDDRSGFAVLVVKVPPDAVDDLIAALDDTGIVQSLNQSARDVTEQLIDLDVRIDNARASVANVRAFMDRTQNLTELVTLEAELTRRQTELEQLEAQRRNLSERVALATVTVEIVPTASMPEPDAGDGIGGAFDDGLRAFAAVVYGIVLVLAVLAPFLIAGAMAAGLVWLIVRRPPRRDTASTADRTRTRTRSAKTPTCPARRAEHPIDHRAVGKRERCAETRVGDHRRQVERTHHTGGAQRRHRCAGISSRSIRPTPPTSTTPCTTPACAYPSSIGTGGETAYHSRSIAVGVGTP